MPDLWFDRSCDPCTNQSVPRRRLRKSASEIQSLPRLSCVVVVCRALPLGKLEGTVLKQAEPIFPEQQLPSSSVMLCLLAGECNGRPIYHHFAQRKGPFFVLTGPLHSLSHRAARCFPILCRAALFHSLKKFPNSGKRDVLTVTEDFSEVSNLVLRCVTMLSWHESNTISD